MPGFLPSKVSIQKSPLPRWLLQGVVLCTAMAAWTAQAHQTAALRGEVVDSTTHRPIARVLVQSPTGGSSVLTDNTGHFQFPAVSLGTVNLGYRRPGYFDPLTGQQFATSVVKLAADTPLQTLLLEPAATIRGQLLLPDGDSPVGLHVTLYGEQVTDGRRHWQILQNTAVRSDGSFLFGELTAGSFLVHAEASVDPAPGNAPPTTRLGYAPVWAPDTSEVRSASVLSPAPGQTVEVRLRLARVPFYPVTVRVAGDAHPRSFEITGNGFVNWTPRFDRNNEMLVTELPNGSYVLSTASRQGSSSELPFHVEGAPVSGLSIAVQDGAVQDGIVGIVPGKSFDDSRGNTLQLNSLTLIPANAPDQPIYQLSALFDSASGIATLHTGVPPGQYWVSALSVSGGYLTALSSGGVDLFTSPFTIAPGTQPTFTVSFGHDTGTINVVLEGELVGHPCTVQLVPLSPGGVGRTGIVTGSAGFGTLPPGDYLVVATTSRRALAFREPGVLPQLTGTRVTVTANGTTQAALSGFLSLPAGAEGGP